MPVRREPQVAAPGAAPDRAVPEVVGTLDFAPGTDPDYIARLEAAASGARDASMQLQPKGGVLGFEIAGRWPGEMTDPIELTWSFVPDDTTIIDEQGMLATSTLFFNMRNQFGDDSWIDIFQSIFDRYELFSGIDFTRVVFENEADDQAPWGSPELPGVRGHIRIGMAMLDGPNGLLAFAQEPQLPSPGEIVLDSSEDWFLAPWSIYGAANSIAHEVGHAIGLDHICPDNNTKLMEPFSGMPNWGPQHDDLRGTHSLYGDLYESNDTRQTAARLYVPPLHYFVNYGEIGQPFGPYGPGSPSGLLSIDRSDDVDWYEFQVTEPMRLLLTVDPIGHLYAMAAETCGTGFQCCPELLTHSERMVDLVVEFRDRNLNAMRLGSTLTGHPFGFAVDLLEVNVPYYLRISPDPQGGDFAPQCYDITVEPIEVSSDCSTQGCDDGDPWNGVESCTPGGGCVVSPLAADCNMNWFEDEWDILSGTSQDCNNDGVPDECEVDCNDNGFADECDIVGGVSTDCNDNGIPDECEEDCNGNGIADICDIAAGTSVDPNRNGVPNECEQVLQVPQQFATLSEALLNANNGDTIQLAPGTYDTGGFRNLEIIDKTVQIVSTGTAATTVIDLKGLGRAAYIASVNKPNRTTIRGIWFQNGIAGPSIPEAGRGGALFVSDADVSIRNCIFSANSAFFDGGAIVLAGSGTMLTNVTSCLFYDNAAESGGAVSILGPIFPNLVNCTLTENTVSALGAAIYAPEPETGGGIANSIVWNNTSALGKEVDEDFQQPFAVVYSNLPADVLALYSSPPPGCFSADPRFVNPANDNFHIRRASPCLDAGNPNTSYGAAAVDVDGEPRIANFIVDMGSDERPLD